MKEKDGMSDFMLRITKKSPPSLMNKSQKEIAEGETARISISLSLVSLKKEKQIILQSMILKLFI